MRLGCCVGTDQIQQAQDAGYDYVELSVWSVKAEQPDSEFEPVRELLESFEIRPEAWNCLVPSVMKVVGPEVDIYRVERFLRTAFERIEEVGGEMVVFGSGPARTMPEGFPADEAQDQLVEFLTMAGQVAGAYGLTIAIEPLNKTATNTINTVPQAIELARRVDHPFVKVLVDLTHMGIDGEPLSDIAIAAGELVHAHVADTDIRYPGSGNYPIKEFIEAIKATGYDDRLTVECFWGEDFETELVKSLGYLRQWA